MPTTSSQSIAGALFFFKLRSLPTLLPSLSLFWRPVMKAHSLAVTNWTNSSVLIPVVFAYFHKSHLFLFVMSSVLTRSYFTICNAKDHGNLDAFEPWCWRRLLRVPWTARRSNQSILKEINPEYSLEGLMLKLKFQYFGHLMWRVDSLEKILMLGKTEGRRKRAVRWDGWMASWTQWTWVWTGSGRWWRMGKPGVLQSIGSGGVRHDLATEWQQQWEHKQCKPRQHIKKQRYHFADKGLYSQSYVFSSSHEWMWELDHKEGWVLKNWCFWTMVLEKTLASPLDCKEIQPVNPRGNQS